MRFRPGELFIVLAGDMGGIDLESLTTHCLISRIEAAEGNSAFVVTRFLSPAAS